MSWWWWYLYCLFNNVLSYLSRKNYQIKFMVVWGNLSETCHVFFKEKHCPVWNKIFISWQNDEVFDSRFVQLRIICKFHAVFERIEAFNAVWLPSNCQCKWHKLHWNTSNSGQGLFLNLIMWFFELVLK